MERCSDEFLLGFRETDLVIAKRQANHESLEGTEAAGNKTFFVLRAKCEIVADCARVKYLNEAISFKEEWNRLLSSII